MIFFSVDVPVFHKLPKDVTTEEGKTIEFYCDVMGDPPIKVQWSKEDGAVSFGRYETHIVLTHFSLVTPKRVIGKQCRPRSDDTECGI